MNTSAVELFVLGTGHSVAPGPVRERMHVDLDDVFAALDRLLTGRGVLDEAIPLATCARLELYCVSRSPDRALRLLRQLVAHRTGTDPEEIDAHSYAHRGPDAVRHLFRVAAGLDSVVYGEAQILGQVRDALHHPSTAHVEGPLLHRLFESALSAGKRVRTETEIGRGAASLASASLSMLRREVGSLEPLSALVLGAGHTGALVARLLRKSGVARLVIANRTQARAKELAAELGAEAASLSNLPELLSQADVVVGAVDRSAHLVGPKELAPHSASATQRTRYLLDLGHPRNFDPSLAAVPNVRLFDLEHVYQRVEAARTARAAQLPQAEAIVAEEAERFGRWLRSRGSVSVLRAVRTRMLELAHAEAARHGRGLSDTEQKRMRQIAVRVAKSLLHRPTVALRDADPSSPEGRALLESAEALFGVDPDANGSVRRR